MTTRLDTILNQKGRTVHSIAGEATVFEAVQLMNRERIGALLVVKESHPLGIFTERDVLARVMEGARDPRTTMVRDVMTTPVVVVSPCTTVEQAMAVMTERRCRHLPVLDDGALCGMVSIGDLTRWMVHDKEFLIDQLHNYLTDQYPC